MKYWTLANLDIIATNTVVGELWAAPRIIAPVFKDRTTGAVIVPPVRFSADEVFDATEINEARYQELVSSEKLVPLRAPFSGKANHDLWIDELGEIRYEPKWVVKKAFAKIFDDQLARAQDCFTRSEYEQAAKHAFTARAVNPSNIDALVIRAASERRLHQHQRFAFTCEIAQSYISSKAFHELVNAMIGDSSTTEAHGCAAMNDIAKKKSRLAVAA